MGKKTKISESSIKKDLSSGRFIDAVDKYQLMGENQRKEGDFDKAIGLIEKGLELANEHTCYLEASFCLRSLSEIYALQGKYEVSMYHADEMMKNAKKAKNTSQIQLASHIKAWCIQKLFDFGNVGKTQLEEAVELTIQSRRYLEDNEKLIKKAEVYGTIEERKANLLILESQLHQLLDRNGKAKRMLDEADTVIGDKYQDIKFEIFLTKCGLEAPDSRLDIAKKLETYAPSNKKGNAIMEYSHQLILHSKLKEGYSELIRAYVEHRKNISVDDTNDIVQRLPIVYKLEKYDTLLKSTRRGKMTKDQIYEALADLYDAYYRFVELEIDCDQAWRTMTEKEKKEYSSFVKDNIVQNYKNMIDNTTSLAVKIRGYLAIGLVYFDIEEYAAAKINFSARLQFLRSNQGSETDIVDAEISIFKCDCKLDNNGVELITKFENLEKRAVKPESRQELYETWSSHFEDMNDKKRRDEYKRKAERIEVKLEENTDDETDKLFEGCSNEEILAMCVEDHERVLLEISLRQQISKTNKHGETKLHEAAKESNPEMVKMLIDVGYKVNAKDNGGWTPLTEAIDNNELENVILLIEAGAELNTVSSVGVENVTGSSSQENGHTLLTPLMNACCNGFVDIASILVKHGARMEMRDRLGWTAYDHLEKFMRDHETNEEHRKFAVWMKSAMKDRGIEMKNAGKMNYHSKRSSVEPSSEQDDCIITRDIPPKKRKNTEPNNSSVKRKQTTLNFSRVSTSPELVFRPISPHLHRSPLVDLGDVDDFPISVPSGFRRSLSPPTKSRNNSSIPEAVTKHISPLHVADSSRIISISTPPSNPFDDVVVKIIFSSPATSGAKINNAIFQMMRTSNICDVKTRVREHLKNQNFEITSIWQHSDVDKCVLSDDFCISLLGGEITFNCELSTAAASSIYKKSKDPIQDVITRLVKFELTGFCDLSNVLRDEVVYEVAKALRNYSPKNGEDEQEVSLDFSRCDLTLEIEGNLRSIVRNAKSLVMRSTTSENYYQELFEKFNGWKLEKVELSVLEFRDQSQLCLILAQFPNVQNLSLIGIKMPKNTISQIPDVLKDFCKLTKLDLSASKWATEEDWEVILSKMENLKDLGMNHVDTDVVWQPDWLPNLEILSCRSSKFNWSSVVDFLSVSIVSRIDMRAAIVDKKIIDDIRKNSSLRVVSEKV